MNSKAFVTRLLEAWDAAIATGDPDAVLELYAPDAVLLPTLSDRVRSDRAAIHEYFEHFLALRPRAEVHESHQRLFGSIAVNSGVYSFRFERGPMTAAKARFTFVYRAEGDRWPIVEHHSSLLPEPCRIEFHAAGVPDRCRRAYACAMEVGRSAEPGVSDASAGER